MLSLALFVASSMTLCDAAAEASRLSGWRYEVADAACAAPIDTSVPDDARDARSGAWFETDAALAGYLLVEGDGVTRVVARDAPLLAAITRASASCKPAKKSAPRPLVARMKRGRDGAITTDIDGPQGACLARALAKAPLPEASAAGSTVFSFSLTATPVRLARGSLARK